MIKGTFLGPPPEDFVEACRKLRDEYDIDPLIDPDDTVTVANFYPHMTVEQVAERLGRDPEEWQYWTPHRMQNRIYELRAEAEEYYND